MSMLLRAARRLLLICVIALSSLAVVSCGSSVGAQTATNEPASATQSTAAQTAAGTGKPTLHYDHITPTGTYRDYLLLVPAHPTRRMPLVIVMHGSGGTDTNMYTSTDFAKVAAAHNWLVAYPQGYDGTWNDGASVTPTRKRGTRDVAFLTAMVHQIEAHYSVDTNLVAAAGVSNGAFMAQYLGCQAASVFRFIEPAEGELPDRDAATCHPTNPVNVLEIHAIHDPEVAYGGGLTYGTGGTFNVLSAQASVAKWASLDGCGSSPDSQNVPDRVLSVYSGCHAGVSVELVSINGDKHLFPPDAGTLLAGAFAKLG